MAEGDELLPEDREFALGTAQAEAKVHAQDKFAPVESFYIYVKNVFCVKINNIFNALTACRAGDAMHRHEALIKNMQKRRK